MAGLGTLYVKAALGAVGPRGHELPDTVLGDDVMVDRDHLAEYAHVCGFPVADTLPVTYPHVLAFPLALELMTDLSFPFPLLGMVHIANRIEQRRPLSVDERPTLRVRTESLRDHDRGRQFDVVTRADVDGETVWEEWSTYLHREGGGDGGGGGGSDSEPPDDPDDVWEVPDDVGRRYGMVSGDVNPIHMHPLPAKLFGFPSAIAHGMWLKARCLGALEDRLPESLNVEAQFKKPLVLPAEVAFESGRSGQRIDFAARDAESGSSHLTGQARRLRQANSQSGRSPEGGGRSGGRGRSKGGGRS